MATTYNVRYVDADAEVGGTGTTNALTGGTCAYKSLSIWEAARDADLTTGDGASNYVVERAICGSAHANHTADTTGLFVNGFTTSANSYIDILTDASNRAGLSWSASKYRLYVADSSALIIADDFVRVDGLQIGKSSSSANTQGCITYSSIAATNDERVSGCLLRQAGNATYTEPCVYVNDSDAIVTIWNTVGYGAGSNAGTANAVFALSAAASSGCALYSCTGIGNTFGVRCGNNVTAVAKNCYFRGTSAAISLGTSSALTQTNCATSDATASGTDPLDNVAYDTDTFVNVTAGSEDFHLAADGNSPLQGAGVDTSGESAPLNFTTDIEGDTRDATWDIGADAWVVAGATPKTSSDILVGVFADAMTGTGAATAAEALPAVTADAQTGTGDGAVADALAAILAEAAAAGVALSLADALSLLLAESHSGTGDATSADVAALVVAEAVAGTGAVLTADVLYADLQEAHAGTATGTTLDALVAYLVEAGSVASDIVQQAAADVLGLLLAETAAITGVGHTATDATAVLLAEALSGTATMTVADLAAALLSDAISATGTAASADTLAAVLSEMATVVSGLVSQVSTDTLAVALAEAHVGTAAGTIADLTGLSWAETMTGTATGTLADALAAALLETHEAGVVVASADDVAFLLAEGHTTVAATVATDQLAALLAEAITATGTAATADTLAAQLAEAGLAETDLTTADAVALVLVGAGTAAAVLPLTPFLVGVLVVTWPTRTLVSLQPAYTLVNRTTGWPYTLVQKVA